MGGAHGGPRRTEAQGPLWVFPVSSPGSRTEPAGPNPPSRRGTFWQPEAKVSAPPPADENRESGSHPRQAWEPMGWGVPLHPLPLPLRNSTEAASFLLLRKKHFVLSFLSSVRLGISVSSDCTVLGPWHTSPNPPRGQEVAADLGGGSPQRSGLSLTPAQCQGSEQEAPSWTWNFLAWWESSSSSQPAPRVIGLSWALLTPGPPNTTAWMHLGERSPRGGTPGGRACILAQALPPNLRVTLGTSWLGAGGVLTRKAQCQSPAACFTLEPVM